MAKNSKKGTRIPIEEFRKPLLQRNGDAAYEPVKECGRAVFEPNPDDPKGGKRPKMEVRTIGSLIAEVLDEDPKQERQDRESKMHCDALAREMYRPDGFVELDSKDIEMIKTCVCDSCPPFVYGQIHDLLENGKGATGAVNEDE